MNLLSPIASLYGAAVRLRRWAYAAGVLQTSRLRAPVISVGNLTMGGTGKTPTTIALGKRLLEAGHRVAVLSRGYKGKHNGGPLLVSDGQRIHATATEAGDEALVIARNLPRALVAVAAKRAQAGAWLEKNYDVDVYLLDDGFQHLQLHRDLNLLLVDVTNPFGGGLPPQGRLREPVDAIRRADAVILSRTEAGQRYEELIDLVHRYKPGIPCFFARQRLVGLSKVGEDSELPAETLRGLDAIAFAGIANSAQFLTTLKHAGIRIAQFVSFPDHHYYSAEDCQRLVRESEKLQLRSLITTEKDAVKLSSAKFAPLDVFTTKLAFEFDDIPRLSRLLSDVVGAAER